jgi:hypothetical protein
LYADERFSVVTLDCPWHSVPTEQPLKFLLDLFDSWRRQKLRAQHKPAERITYGERLTSRTIACPPMTLEVDRPHIVARLGLDLGSSLDHAHGRPWPPAPHESESVQNASDRRSTWSLSPKTFPHQID